MTTTHTNLALVGGEVLILNSDNENIETGVTYFNHSNNVIGCYGTMGDLGNWFERKNYSKIIASTLKIKNTPQLDRKWFVKPKVDVEELATICLQKEGYQPLYTTRAGFKIGYNAKEAEFTRGEMFSLVVAVQNKEVVSFDDFEKYMNKIHPLSLPKSVTLNESNEVIAVEWQ